PSIRAGSGAYMSALYGVSPRESQASGLAEYSASSGIESLAFQGIVSLPVGENWRLTSVVRLGELMDEAAGSSLITQPTQFFAVTALTRSF
ncbi:MAG: MipA/OmpV family protein, partial [Pseudomonadota bacterium]|nr:MipA/OmpV family protein [Pseudomonadota bacterium]